MKLIHVATILWLGAACGCGDSSVSQDTPMQPAPNWLTATA